MNGCANIFAYSNEELVSFLLKIGQHEAVKIVRKYDIDGNLLLAISDQDIYVKFTENEKRVLLGIINNTKLSIGTITRNKQISESDESETSSSQDLLQITETLTRNKQISESEEAETSYSQDLLQITDGSSTDNDLKESNEDKKVDIDVRKKSSGKCIAKEGIYLEMADLSRKLDNNTYMEMKSPPTFNRLSTKYFKFYGTPIQVQAGEKKFNIFPSTSHISHFTYLEPFEDDLPVREPRESNASSDYIQPRGTQVQHRFEEITIDRIKRYVRPEDLVAIGQHPSYIEVIQPNSNDSPDANKNENETEKNKTMGVCDFVLQFCGYSCFLGCKKK